MMEPSYLPSSSWFCSYIHLLCELIAARDERHGRIQNFRCLSQVLIRITLICWNLLETSFLEHFFFSVYDVIIDILQSMVLFTTTFTAVS